MSSEFSYGEPSEENKDTLFEIEQDFEPSEYSEAIENFYNAHTKFFKDFLGRLQSNEFSGDKKINYDSTSLVENLDVLMQSINNNEKTWEDKVATLAGFIWAETNQRCDHLNSVIQDPSLKINELGEAINQTDIEEKISRFIKILNDSRQTYEDDISVLHQIRNNYPYVLRKSIKTAVTHYSADNNRPSDE